MYYLAGQMALTELRPGDKAPDFTAYDQEGNKVSLKQFRGQRVALYFYPHDDTPSCTRQACNIRDNFALLQEKGITVLGISTDTVQQHDKFRKKYGLPFTLIADPDLAIVQRYGIWGEKQFMGRTIIGTHRTTFLVNAKGKIEHIIEKVVTKDHAAQILELWS
jgi:peroxiredoxin Q/BCP